MERKALRTTFRVSGKIDGAGCVLCAVAITHHCLEQRDSATGSTTAKMSNVNANLNHPTPLRSSHRRIVPSPRIICSPCVKLKIPRRLITHGACATCILASNQTRQTVPVTNSFTSWKTIIYLAAPIVSFVVLLSGKSHALLLQETTRPIGIVGPCSHLHMKASEAASSSSNSSVEKPLPPGRPTTPFLNIFFDDTAHLLNPRDMKLLARKEAFGPIFKTNFLFRPVGLCRK